jgi:excisionase family DNA binding protein
MDKLLTAKEAAQTLTCSVAAIRKWLYQRKLPKVKVERLTRIRQKDLEAFVAQGSAKQARMPPQSASGEVAYTPLRQYRLPAENYPL